MLFTPPERGRGSASTKPTDSMSARRAAQVSCTQRRFNACLQLPCDLLQRPTYSNSEVDLCRFKRLSRIHDTFYADVPLEPVGADDVLIEIASTGICGSDVHYHEHCCIGDFVVEEPMTLGHESSVGPNLNSVGPARLLTIPDIWLDAGHHRPPWLQRHLAQDWRPRRARARKGLRALPDLHERQV